MIQASGVQPTSCRTKEMMQPCLLYQHVISLVPLTCCSRRLDARIGAAGGSGDAGRCAAHAGAIAPARVSWAFIARFLRGPTERGCVRRAGWGRCVVSGSSRVFGPRTVRPLGCGMGPTRQRVPRLEQE